MIFSTINDPYFSEQSGTEAEKAAEILHFDYSPRYDTLQIYPTSLYIPASNSSMQEYFSQANAASAV